jgi:MFS transporter, DHA1 family, multidrug resistance protein
VTHTAGISTGGWQFLLVLFTVSTFLEVAAWGQAQAFGPLYIETVLGVPSDDVPRWTGILTAAPLLVAVPLSPFWGVLGDKYSKKLIILRCLLIAAVGYGIAAVVQDIWQLLGVRFLLGLTFGGNAVILAIMAVLVPTRWLGLSIGITQMMFPLGNSIGPLLGSGLIAWVGLRGMFAVNAGITLFAFLLVLLLYREPPRSRDQHLTILQRLRAVAVMTWRQEPIRFAFIVFGLFSGGWTLVTPFIPVLIARVYEGANLALAIGLIMGANGALAGIAAPVAGRLADRLGPTRLITFNMLGLMLMSLLLVFAATPQAVALAMVLGAIPYGASNTALYAHLARVTPRDHMTAVMSLTPLARNSAMLGAPLLGAAVAGLGLSAIFATAVVVFGLAVGTSRVLARSRPPSPPAVSEVVARGP